MQLPMMRGLARGRGRIEQLASADARDRAGLAMARVASRVGDD